MMRARSVRKERRGGEVPSQDETKGEGRDRQAKCQAKMKKKKKK